MLRLVNNMDWQERIVTDASILSGQPTVKATRLSVAFVLDRLADGESEADLLAGYPQLSTDDIRACLRYASERVAPQKVSPISDMIDSQVIPQKARAMLAKADERFRHYDLCEGSRLLWQTVEWAIRDVAARRGWPAGEERELEQVLERLDAETDEKHTLAGGFILALTVRENADGYWLHESDIGFFAELMPPFIEGIFVAAATTV